MKLLSTCLLSSDDLEFVKLTKEHKTANQAHHLICKNANTKISNLLTYKYDINFN